MRKLRLGLNIDHVATLRNARGGTYPDPIQAAHLAQKTGLIDGITAHLREDRRHMRDVDIHRIAQKIDLPLNLEMAATTEMQDIALEIRPHAVCLVPERRMERTTEGGLDVAQNSAHLSAFIQPLQAAGIRVSLFIAPQTIQIEAAHAINSDVIELHTGTYSALLDDAKRQNHALDEIIKAAELAHGLGLEVHAGHGLDYENVAPIARISEICELNIGHFLIAQSIFVGLKQSLLEMRQRMDAVR